MKGSRQVCQEFGELSGPFDLVLKKNKINTQSPVLLVIHNQVQQPTAVTKEHTYNMTYMYNVCGGIPVT